MDETERWPLVSVAHPGGVSNMNTKLRFGVSASLALLAFCAVIAAPFTTGNIVVLRAGPGQNAGALNNHPTPITLVELNVTSGAIIQELAMPTSGASALTVSGSATSEGQLSYNNGLFSFGAYNQGTGLGSSVAATLSANVNRVLAKVDLNGTVDTSTRLADAYSAGNPRAGVAIDAGSGYIAGTGTTGTGGVRYAIAGQSTSTQIFDTPTNIRNVKIYNGDLYFTTASAGFLGLYKIDGLPTSGGQAFNPVVTFAVGQSPYDFIFMDGGNTLYIVEDSTSSFGAYRYTLSGGVYTGGTRVDNGMSSAGPRSITGYEDPITGNNILFCTTSNATSSNVFRLEDIGLVPQWAVFATADTGFAFRGIQVVPATSGVTRKISGTVDLGGTFVGTRSATTRLTFQVFEVGNTLTPLYETVLDVDNTTKAFELTLPAAVTANAVDVRVGGRDSTFLFDRVANVALGTTGVTGVVASPINGNIDTDESITVFDYDVLSSAFDTNEGDAGFDPRADLDQDGSVTVFDYDILSQNFDLSDEA